MAEVVRLLTGQERRNDAGMTITQFDPDDSVAMGQWYDLAVAVRHHDLPDFPTPSTDQPRTRTDAG